ncbi:putative peptidyl-prolyl cis-trans isomerase [Anatilimnocola aggregata]|uniref:peptidylprolyl isomerase n=1 Tax=Anatilimnocola aggregata TaxID=2528021 RepID=A0A517Y4M6_9BACT|nr:peptidylprolyl isomerase [Anatilimnocola aggregata]QDU25082.1 putative peptidyl-prolyl cis-trans isomerase [Anatilimnocola aggregata]
MKYYLSAAARSIPFLSLFIVLSTGCALFGQPAAEPKGEAAKVEDKKTEDKPAGTKPEKPAEAPADNSPAGKFKASQARWNAVDKQLGELAAAYGQQTDPAKKAEMKAEYIKLVAESETILPELRAAAEAAFAAEPNKIADVTRTLIGMVAFDVRRDENENALKLAKLMIDKKCEEPALYSFAGVAAYRLDDYDTAEKYLKLASDAGRIDADGREYLAELPTQKKAWEAEKLIREKEAKADDLPRVKLETSKGPVVIELFENEAPGAVGNFINLVEKKFYDGLTFHRVLPNFMAQGGDPTGDGSGGPGYEIYCECERPDARMHFRGTMSMAHAGKDTGGSQFFLTFRPTTHLNKRHTAFGRVVEGFDVLAKLQRRDPQAPTPPQPDKIVKAEVLRKRNHDYKPNKVE